MRIITCLGVQLHFEVLVLLPVGANVTTITHCAQFCELNIFNLKMKNFEEEELVRYLDKIETKTLLAYGVYQVEADGFDLFEYI